MLGGKLCRTGGALLLLLAIQACGSATGRMLRAGDSAAPAPGGSEAPAQAPAATPGAAPDAPLPAPATGSEVDVSADVYNGLPAPAGLFDFMVRIKLAHIDQDTGSTVVSHFCGGTLINANTVLTASHCLVMKDGNVPADALVLEIQGIDYQASAVHPHPSFSLDALEAQNLDFQDGRVDSPLAPFYDIAAIKLATPALGAPTAQLPAADLQLLPGQDVEVAGWGRTGSSEDLPASDTLLYTPLELFAPFDFANQGAPGTCPLPTFIDALCGMNTASGGNACAGDSGGPLLLRDFLTGVATVVGVVSHGPPCDEFPLGIYTDVRLYLSEVAAWMAIP